LKNQRVGEDAENVKSHFRHFYRGFRETRFSAKMPILAPKRPAGQSSETAKFPTHRQNCRRIREMAFSEKLPILLAS